MAKSRQRIGDGRRRALSSGHHVQRASQETDIEGRHHGSLSKKYRSLVCKAIRLKRCQSGSDVGVCLGGSERKPHRARRAMDATPDEYQSLLLSPSDMYQRY
ncbi:hypothetical protein CBM2585_A130095 [Cupriavidus taiwanensis]|nr:hypothetical protein CBM2585_A130095 [Cupriavidus taiwanensis]